MSVPISARITYALARLMPGMSSSRATRCASGAACAAIWASREAISAVIASTPGQHGAQQERVMIGEVAGERLFQHGDLLAHAAPGQLREHLGAALSGHQRGEHVPPGQA